MNTMIGRCVSFLPPQGRAPAEFVLRNGDTCRVFKTFHKSPLRVGGLYAVEYRDNDREHNGKWYAGRLADAVAECREPKNEPERVQDEMIPPGDEAGDGELKHEGIADDIPF